jgi:predicted DCC family thiol-disulfide oxidoreductase YuxK
MSDSSEENPVLLFDGDCSLCNKSVLFVLRNEKHPKLFFASLQSAYASKLLSTFQHDLPLPDSIVLIEKGKILIRSDAALRLAVLMGGWTRVYAILYVFPRFLRDAVYNFIARNRKKIFGISEYCGMMPEVDKTRFKDIFD